MASAQITARPRLVNAILRFQLTVVSLRAVGITAGSLKILRFCLPSAADASKYSSRFALGEHAELFVWGKQLDSKSVLPEYLPMSRVPVKRSDLLQLYGSEAEATNVHMESSTSFPLFSTLSVLHISVLSTPNMCMASPIFGFNHAHLHSLTNHSQRYAPMTCREQKRFMLTKVGSAKLASTTINNIKALISWRETGKFPVVVKQSSFILQFAQ